MSVSSLVRATQYVQTHDLLNRGILDTAGAAVPIIGLARTQQERKEKILDRSIVIGSAFVLAPLHALGFMGLFSWTHKLNPALMRLSYTDLLSTQSLDAGMKRLVKTMPKLTRAQLMPAGRTLSQLRQQLVKAKTDMLIPDLILECLIFGGVGWITNFFSRLSTGKNRFSGELKATSEQNLKALYAKESAYQRSEKIRMIATLATSIGVPLLGGLLLRHAMLKAGAVKGVMGFIRKHAHRFDYQDGYWMSMPTLGIVVGMQFMGHLMAARNKRELRENFLRETMLNTSFFWGNAAWLALISRPIFKALKLPQETDIGKLIAKAPQTFKARAATAGTWTYLASLGLNSATLAAVILLNNILTHRNVEKAVSKLPGPQLPPMLPSPSVSASFPLPAWSPFPSVPYAMPAYSQRMPV